MPSQHRKHRGLRTERVVAQYLSQWWKGAAVGRGAGKDVVNVPFDLEIKSRSDFQPLAWLRQSQKRTEKTGELNLVCVRMNGQGEKVEDYLAFMSMGDLTQLLLRAGYSDFQADTGKLIPIYCACGNTIMEGSPCRICEKLDNEYGKGSWKLPDGHPRRVGLE